MTTRYTLRVPRAAVDDWGDAPHALGMQIDEDGALAGTWSGGIRVRAVHRCYAEQSRVNQPSAPGPTRGPSWHYETNYGYLTRYEATLDPPLLLALLARQLAPTLPNRTSFDPARGPELEKHFGFYAIDRTHAARVLRGDVMEEVLRDADARRDPLPGAPAIGTYNVTITDTAVTALGVVNDYLVDVDALRDGLERVARIAGRVLAQRALELATWEPGAREDWALVARRRDLTFDPARVSITGDLRGHTVDMRATIEPNPDAQRLPDHVSVRIALTFPRPLACGLTLTPQGPAGGAIAGLLKRVFGGQDVVVGDARFDAAFTVKGTSEPGVRALLSAGVRDRLLALAERAPALRVDPGGLSLVVAEATRRDVPLGLLLDSAMEAALALVDGG